MDSTDPPKLSLFSFPNTAQEPPGLQTPPIHTSASVPFQWEEAPGKPRPDRNNSQASSKHSSAARCLELPPRLLITENHNNKITNTSSPTTVMDGPYVGRSLSFRKGVPSSSSFRAHGLESGGGGGKDRVFFGSSRWGSFRKNNTDVVGVEGGFDLLPSDDDNSRGDGSGGRGNSGGTKVKITRIKKRSTSFLSVPHSSPHWWTSMYESVKHVVPWRRRQDQKLRKKMGS